MRRLATTTLVITVLFGLGTLRPLQARPNYKKCFDEVFKDELKGSNKTTCNVCHIGDDKKKLNSYGQKLEKELGEKMVKEEQKIKEALKKIGFPKLPKN